MAKRRQHNARDVVQEEVCRMLECKLRDVRASWDWEELSANAAITPQFVEAHLSFPWSWSALTRNPNVTWPFILRFCDKPWDWLCVSRRSDLTLAAVRAHRELPWRWGALSANPCFAWEDIACTLGELPWDWAGVSRNPAIDIAAIHTTSKVHPWDWVGVVRCNRSLTMAYVEERFGLDSAWVYEAFSHNPNCTWEDVRRRLDNEWWDWYQVSKRFVTWSDVAAHPELPWNWAGLSQNPNMTWEVVLNNLEMPWVWWYLSESDRVSWRLIGDTLDVFAWEPGAISCRHDVSLDAALWHSHVDWQWNKLCRHARGFTWQAVHEPAHACLPLCWKALSANAEVLCCEAELQSTRRRHMAAFRIQQHWRRAVSSPQFEVCRRRLMREAKELCWLLQPSAKQPSAKQPSAKEQQSQSHQVRGGGSNKRPRLRRCVFD